MENMAKSYSGQKSEELGGDIRRPVSAGVNETASAMIVRPFARTADTVVCVPTYNEVGTIGLLLDGLLGLSRSLDILVIDDGSTDGTEAAVLCRITAGSPVYLIQRHEK